MMLLLFLLHIFPFIGCSWGADEGCFHHSSITCNADFEGKGQISATIFIADNYNILLQIAFEEKDEGLEADYISVKHDKNYEIKIKRKNEKDSFTFGVLSAPIPVGWVNMNITFNKFDIQIPPYIDKITTDFPIRNMIVSSEYMFKCPRGTPSWKIERNQSVTVPTRVIYSSRISITSTKEFSPIIRIGNKSNFTLDLQDILGTSGSKLAANKYHFVIESNNGTTTLTHQGEECNIRLLAVLQLETNLTYITASTLNEDYLLVLEPMADNPCNANTSNNQNSSDNYIWTKKWIIISAIFIFLLLGSNIFLIIVVFKLWKDNKESKHLLERKKDKTHSISEVDEIDETEQFDTNRNEDTGVELRKRNKIKTCDKDLWGAIKSNDLGALKKAFADGSDVNHKQGEWGETPLHKASWKGNLPVVKVLLKHGAKQDVADTGGQIPLHNACKGGNIDVVKELLKDAGRAIFINLKTRYGITPLQMVRIHGFNNIEQALLNAGANDNDGGENEVHEV